MPILYRFPDLLDKNLSFFAVWPTYPVSFEVVSRGSPRSWGTKVGIEKLESLATRWWKLHDPMVISFESISACDGRKHRLLLICASLAKAVTRIFFGGVTLRLSAVGAKIETTGGGLGLGRGCPLPRKLLHFLFLNGEFLCMPNLT